MNRCSLLSSPHGIDIRFLKSTNGQLLNFIIRNAPFGSVQNTVYQGKNVTKEQTTSEKPRTFSISKEQSHLLARSKCSKMWFDLPTEDKLPFDVTH